MEDLIGVLFILIIIISGAVQTLRERFRNNQRSPGDTAPSDRDLQGELERMLREEEQSRRRDLPPRPPRPVTREQAPSTPPPPRAEARPQPQPQPQPRPQPRRAPAPPPPPPPSSRPTGPKPSHQRPAQPPKPAPRPLPSVPTGVKTRKPRRPRAIPLVPVYPEAVTRTEGAPAHTQSGRPAPRRHKRRLDLNPSKMKEAFILSEIVREPLAQRRPELR